MSITTTEPAVTGVATSAWRELDSREADCGNVRVALLWHPDSRRVLVSVLDRVSGQTLHIPVLASQKASVVYNHPYVYADQSWESDPRFGA